MEEGGYFAPCFATFLKEDQSVSSLDISLASLKKTSGKNSVLYARSPTPISYPPRPPTQMKNNHQTSFSTLRSSSARNRSSDSIRKYSPDSERIINEQKQMLVQLQEQIRELQEHVFQQNNPTKNSYPNLLNFAADSRTSASSGTNTSLVNNQVEEPHHCEESPNFASKTTSKRGKPPVLQVSSAKQFSNKKKYPKLLLSGTEEKFNEAAYEPARCNSSSEFQESIDVSPIQQVKSKLIFSPVTKTKPSSTKSQLSSTCQTKLSFSPSIKGCEIRPKESPKKVLHVSSKIKQPVFVTDSSDKTICVPKIHYEESGSESSDDDLVEALERKYLAMK